MLARLLGQLDELGIARRARAHPARLRGRRARGRGRPRARLRRRRRRPARDRRRRRASPAPGSSILPGRGRHPPRGARRAAQGPARRHRHAARRRLALAPVRVPGALQARARDQRRLALPRRPPPHERVPRRAQGRRRRPARAGRRPPRGSPSWPPRRPQEWRDELARKERHVARRALARRPARRRGGRGGARARTSPPTTSTTRRARGRAARPRTSCSRPRTRRGCARSVAAAPEDTRRAGARRAGALGHPRRRQPPAAALLGAPAVGGRRRRGRGADPRLRRGQGPARLGRQGQRRLLHDLLRLDLLALHRALVRAPRLHAQPGHDRLAVHRRSLAAAAFATGERWGLVAGAILLQAAFTTDCVDGQLARYTRTFSKLGAWLDSIFDRSKEYVCFAGLAIGASRAGDPVWPLACARDHAADRAPLLGLLLRRRPDAGGRR